MPFSRIGVKLKSRDNGDLVSPGLHHDMVVRPKERAAAILAQVDREMVRLKERDHHWEDGIEVSRFASYHLLSAHLLVECVSTPACYPSPAPLQMDSSTRDVSIIAIETQPRRGDPPSGVACRPGTTWPWRCVTCRPSHYSPVSTFRRIVAPLSALNEHRECGLRDVQ